MAISLEPEEASIEGSQACGPAKFFLRFFGFTLLAQGHSQFKVRGRVVWRGADRGAEL